MKPPTRSSIFWPSSVWVLMIVHSSGSSLPGLLMISLGIAILPTSCSSAANSRLRLRSALRPSVLGDVERERDDALAVLAGVAVVGLDDVAEHQRGAAVGVGELEQALQALVALAGEHGEQRRAAAASASAASGAWWTSSAATRRRRRTAPRRRRRPSVSRSCDDRRAPRAIAKRSAETAKSTGELGGERGEQQPGAGVRGFDVRRSRTPPTGPIENQELPSAGAAAGSAARLPVSDVGQPRERKRDRDRDRHERRRHREQQRDERQLGRDGEARAACRTARGSASDQHEQAERRPGTTEKAVRRIDATQPATAATNPRADEHAREQLARASCSRPRRGARSPRAAPALRGVGSIDMSERVSARRARALTRCRVDRTDVRVRHRRPCPARRLSSAARPRR